MDSDQLENNQIQFTEVENLLLNMSGGLQPKDLTTEETNLLTKSFGENWKEVLGYTD